MKIGIMTFHFVHNQGAVLQCYALQKYLSAQGHDVRVIDYRPGYHAVRYDAWKNPFQYAKWFAGKKKNASPYIKAAFAARSFVRCMYYNLKGIDRENAALFSAFTDKHLRCTKRYTSLKQLQKDPPEMDAYISGSDQLWNPDLLDHEFDEAYFLNFGSDHCKRIAYAVSMGKEFTAEECRQLKKLCAPLDAVSLRENTTVAIDAMERDVHICVDPTLLLNAEDYEGAESAQRESEPYIFVYGFETSAAIQDVVNQVSAQYQCKVINGSPGRVRVEGANVENVRNYAPDRFLSYIKNAEFVVTNSFHGTVFSILYKKKFITVPHTTRGRRMIELLYKLDLSSALWGSPTFSMENDIDYDSVYQKLQELRKASTAYLEKALSGCRGEDIPHQLQEDEVRIDYSLNRKYENLQVKYGYYTDDAKLRKSASGGAASALAETLLMENENGSAKVYGVVYDAGFRAAHFQCTSTVDGLEAFKGSKYIKADMKLPDGESVFSSVANDLRAGKKVMFTGLGCEVGALKKYLEKHDVDERGLYTVDLICHGPTFDAVQADYMSALERRYRSEITDFSVRYKKRGWTPPYIHAVFANGRVYDKPFYETELGYAFKIYSRESCYSCKFKGLDHVADLTIGDYWGIKPGMQAYNRNGVSVFFARTEKGRELLSRMDTSKFVIGDASLDLALRNNQMFEISRARPADLEDFRKNFNEHGLHYACVHSPGFKRYRKSALKKQIKRVLNR